MTVAREGVTANEKVKASKALDLELYQRMQYDNKYDNIKLHTVLTGGFGDGGKGGGDCK